MQVIHRHLRHVAVGLVSALLIACGSDKATAPQVVPDPDPPAQPPPPPPAFVVTGNWTAQRIYGLPLPARIAGGVFEGVTWEVRALTDSLTILADGHWVQRVRVEQEQSDGFFARSIFFDRGVWTREGDVLHFESEWIQNVTFTARVTPTGGLLVDHNFTLDETLPPMTREMTK